MDPSKLLVCEYSLDEDYLEELYSRFDYDKLAPVQVVRVHSGKYIMPDGHHRGVVCVRKNRDVPVEILDSDEKVARAFQNRYAEVRSIGDVYMQYMSAWSLHLPQNVRNLRDLDLNHKHATKEPNRIF